MPMELFHEDWWSRCIDPLQSDPISAQYARVRARDQRALARSQVGRLGRRPGQRRSDKKAKRVLDMRKVGLSYRLIDRNLGLSNNTVMDIVRRDTAGLGG
jgi:putative DNA-invertase from lambdoid prophage Rac